MTRLPCIGLALLCLSLAAAPAPAARIDADIEHVLQRYNIPAATIEIAQDGHPIYTRAFGLSNLEQRTRARIDTHYEVGSITKQFTAASIVQLEEAGKLELDAKVARYVPSAPHADELTVRQLLTQTSGLPEYLEDADLDTAAAKPATFDDLMARIAGKPLVFAPGSQWQYCNTNYIILGRIIEVVSHERYEDYIQHHILDPLGMTETFTVGDEAHIPGMALGYENVNGHIKPRLVGVGQSFGWLAGDLVSTVDDLAKWSNALRDGRVVSARGYALMTTSQMTTQNGDSGYGFGLFIDSYDAQPRIGHTGGDPGFTAADEYFPKQDVRIIALTNDGNGNGHPEAGEMLTNVAFEDLFPDIAIAQRQSSPGENLHITARIKTFFVQVQSGNEDYTTMTPHLAERFKEKYAKAFAENFAPYGAASDFTFKGQRTDAGLTWYDYVIHFGPGASLKFSTAFNASGQIASLSVG